MGGFQLFWVAFDLIFTVVPLKVALGLEKNIFFCVFHGNHYGYTCSFSTKWDTLKYQENQMLSSLLLVSGTILVYGIWNMVCGIWYENGIHSVSHCYLFFYIVLWLTFVRIYIWILTTRSSAPYGHLLLVPACEYTMSLVLVHNLDPQLTLCNIDSHCVTTVYNCTVLKKVNLTCTLGHLDRCKKCKNCDTGAGAEQAQILD